MFHWRAFLDNASGALLNSEPECGSAAVANGE
jgi:hypothetical protein